MPALAEMFLPFNLSGHPALVKPGPPREALPTAVPLVGPLLAVAKLLQSHADWHPARLPGVRFPSPGAPLAC